MKTVSYSNLKFKFWKLYIYGWISKWNIKIYKFDGSAVPYEGLNQTFVYIREVKWEFWGLEITQIISSMQNILLTMQS